MSLAIPKTASYKGLASLKGSRIATSYPVILKRFLKENGIKAEIEEISGSVEIAPSIGLADAVFDIVSTGSTLLTNGLEEVETVMNSEAVMVSRVPLSAEKQEVLQSIALQDEGRETLFREQVHPHECTRFSGGSHKFTSSRHAKPYSGSSSTRRLEQYPFGGEGR